MFEELMDWMKKTVMSEKRVLDSDEVKAKFEEVKANNPIEVPDDDDKEEENKKKEHMAAGRKIVLGLMETNVQMMKVLNEMM
jgi:hypothetical protein